VFIIRCEDIDLSKYHKLRRKWESNIKSKLSWEVKRRSIIVEHIPMRTLRFSGVFVFESNLLGLWLSLKAYQIAKSHDVRCMLFYSIPLLEEDYENAIEYALSNAEYPISLSNETLNILEHALKKLQLPRSRREELINVMSEAKFRLPLYFDWG